MPIKSRDLHGNVPDNAGAALLLIDVVNDFEFQGGDKLLKLALPVGENIAKLKSHARKAGIPVIYVNDNFGKWRSDLNQTVSHCLEDGVRGEPFVKLVLPDKEDYFVLKPKHSGFYGTSLDLLLEHVGARNLILAGIAGNNCVLFTANDAYMRDFKLFVPSDCSVSQTREENEYALEQMEKVLKANVSASSELDLEAMRDSNFTGSGETNKTAKRAKAARQ